MARNRKGKVFSFFSDKYNINFFHKPSGIDDDIDYVFILDDKVQLSLRVYDNVVLVINSVQPLTSTYLAKFYQSLVNDLINQNMFTVMVSKHTNTNVIWNVCNNCPVVEDMRFIQIPLSLYNRLAEHYSDVNKYGLYLLAVTDDLANVVVEPRKQVEVIDTPKTLTNTLTDYRKQVNTLDNALLVKIQSIITKKTGNDISQSKYGDSITLSGITFKLKLMDNSIHITDSTNQDISTIECMSAFETLEECVSICDIYVDSVKTRAVYNICNIREYEKNNDNTLAFSDNSNLFGSFKVKKFVKQ